LARQENERNGKEGDRAAMSGHVQMSPAHVEM
jgi:hypothetical protein